MPLKSSCTALEMLYFRVEENKRKLSKITPEKEFGSGMSDMHIQITKH